MAVFLRLRQLTLETAAGPSVYDFRSGLNVVVGSYGSGKSSMFELIKFVFGGNAELMPAIRQNVHRVALDLTLGTMSVRLSREMGSNEIAVLEAGSASVSEVWAVNAGWRRERAANRLLSMLGLPLTRLPRKSASGATSEPLTFNDLYRYVYLPQSNVDTSVAGHAFPFTERKRKAMFELVFGLTGEQLREAELRRSDVEREIARNEIEVGAIRTFLTRSGAPNGDDLIRRRDTVARELREATEALDELRTQVRLGSDDQKELRDELMRVRTRLTDAEADRVSAAARAARSASVVAQLDVDIESLERALTATRALAGLDYVVCPRCLQGLDRAVPAGHCVVCTQPEPDRAELGEAAHHAEVRRLREQRAEAVELLAADRGAGSVAEGQVAMLRQRVVELVFELDRRTEAMTSPALDGAMALAARREAAQAARRELQRADALWDQLAEREGAVADLREQVEALKQIETQQRAQLARNRVRVVEFSEVFDDEIRELHWAGYRTAEVDSSSYLPRINGDEFKQLSVAGARKTIANVAYYMALLGYSLSSPEIQLPSLLIIDSPRKNLGSIPSDLAAGKRIYYRLGLLAAAYPDAQIIIADNGLPDLTTPERRAMHVIELSYERPLLHHIPHPGGQVETVGKRPSK